jgi:hypothetical protein
MRFRVGVAALVYPGPHDPVQVSRSLGPARWLDFVRRIDKGFEFVNAVIMCCALACRTLRWNVFVTVLVLVSAVLTWPIGRRGIGARMQRSVFFLQLPRARRRTGSKVR